MSGGPFIALYGGKTVEVNIASASARSAKTRIAGPFPRSAETEALVQLLAAAPDFLSIACQQEAFWEKRLKELGSLSDEAAILRAANLAVIAKATGEAS